MLAHTSYDIDYSIYYLLAMAWLTEDLYYHCYPSLNTQIPKWIEFGAPTQTPFNQIRCSDIEVHHYVFDLVFL